MKLILVYFWDGKQNDVSLFKEVFSFMCKVLMSDSDNVFMCAHVTCLNKEQIETTQLQPFLPSKK